MWLSQIEYLSSKHTPLSSYGRFSAFALDLTRPKGRFSCEVPYGSVSFYSLVCRVSRALRRSVCSRRARAPRRFSSPPFCFRENVAARLLRVYLYPHPSGACRAARLVRVQNDV